MSGISAEKAALRARMRALPPPDPAAAAAVCREILHLPEFQAARSVLGFYPMASEPDIRPVLQAALDAGKVLSLPRSLPGGILKPGTVQTLDALVPGRWNIPEPPEAAPVPAAVGLVLVPGAAFDRACRRLGHGAGYYDRYLETVPGCITAGICFSQNLTACIPAEPHDRPVDILITENGIIRR